MGISDWQWNVIGSAISNQWFTPISSSIYLFVTRCGCGRRAITNPPPIHVAFACTSINTMLLSPGSCRPHSQPNAALVATRMFAKSNCRPRQTKRAARQGFQNHCPPPPTLYSLLPLAIKRGNSPRAGCLRNRRFRAPAEVGRWLWHVEIDPRQATPGDALDPVVDLIKREELMSSRGATTAFPP